MKSNLTIPKIPQNREKSRFYGKKGDLHINFDHKKLCENLKSTAHRFLLTYDDSEYIRALYKDFFVKEFSVQYGMNNFKQTNAAVGRELLISNYEIFESAQSLFDFECADLYLNSNVTAV